ncbi:MAG TPA: YraN family protein [Candidatus Acidoferrales bacterium]|nr:YraN family protein [Candidatus Acidoferrales bacterium]
MIARLVFAMVDFAARKGLAEASAADTSETASKQRARRTGVRGETYAYWYLRRHGYILIARNYTSPEIKGEIDMVGYDGHVLAFVEVKTRAATNREQPKPEEAVNTDKRRYLARMARQFLRARRLESAPCRFDVLAIETSAGFHPKVRLHKGAFVPDWN